MFLRVSKLVSRPTETDRLKIFNKRELRGSLGDRIKMKIIFLKCDAV
jgi:hypothetical protein